MFSRDYLTKFSEPGFLTRKASGIFSKLDNRPTSKETDRFADFFLRHLIRLALVLHYEELSRADLTLQQVGVQ